MPTPTPSTTSAVARLTTTSSSSIASSAPSWDSLFNNGPPSLNLPAHFPRQPGYARVRVFISLQNKCTGLPDKGALLVALSCHGDSATPSFAMSWQQQQQQQQQQPKQQQQQQVLGTSSSAPDPTRPMSSSSSSAPLSSVYIVASSTQLQFWRVLASLFECQQSLPPATPPLVSVLWSHAITVPATAQSGGTLFGEVEVRLRSSLTSQHRQAMQTQTLAVRSDYIMLLHYIRALQGNPGSKLADHPLSSLSDVLAAVTDEKRARTLGQPARSTQQQPKSRYCIAPTQLNDFPMKSLVRVVSAPHPPVDLDPQDKGNCTKSTYRAQIHGQQGSIPSRTTPDLQQLQGVSMPSSSSSNPGVTPAHHRGDVAGDGNGAAHEKEDDDDFDAATSINPQHQSSLGALPSEVLSNIFAFLPPSTLRSTMAVCKKFYVLAANVTPGLRGLQLYPHQLDSVQRMIQMESTDAANPADYITPFELRIAISPDELHESHQQQEHQQQEHQQQEHRQHEQSFSSRLATASASHHTHASSVATSATTSTTTTTACGPSMHAISTLSSSQGPSRSSMQVPFSVLSARRKSSSRSASPGKRPHPPQQQGQPALKKKKGTRPTPPPQLAKDNTVVPTEAPLANAHVKAEERGPAHASDGDVSCYNNSSSSTHKAVTSPPGYFTAPQTAVKKEEEEEAEAEEEEASHEVTSSTELNGTTVIKDEPTCSDDNDDSDDDDDLIMIVDSADASPIRTVPKSEPILVEDGANADGLHKTACKDAASRREHEKDVQESLLSPPLSTTPPRPSPAQRGTMQRCAPRRDNEEDEDEDDDAEGGHEDEEDEEDENGNGHRLPADKQSGAAISGVRTPTNRRHNFSAKKAASEHSLLENMATTAAFMSRRRRSSRRINSRYASLTRQSPAAARQPQQKRANASEHNSLPTAEAASVVPLPVSYLEDKRTMYFDPSEGHLTCRPKYTYPLVRGGLLCDEPGLGKTITVLALLLRSSPYGSIPAAETSLRQHGTNGNNTSTNNANYGSMDGAREDTALEQASDSPRQNPQQSEPETMASVIAQERFSQEEAHILTNPEILLPSRALPIISKVEACIKQQPLGGGVLHELSSPVDEKRYPDYAENIPHPPDSFIGIRRAASFQDPKRPIYSLTGLRLRLTMLLENAIAYNAPGHPIHRVARATLDALNEIIIGELPELQEDRLEELRVKFMPTLRATLIFVPDNAMVSHWVSKFQVHGTQAYLGPIVAIQSGSSSTTLLQWDAATSPGVIGQLMRAGVVICPIDVLSKIQEQHSGLRSLFFDYRWHRVVVDEGHVLGRRGSTRNALLGKIHSGIWWLLTGTPFPLSRQRLAIQHLNTLLEKKTFPAVTDAAWKKRVIEPFVQAKNQLSGLLLTNVLREVMILHAKEQVLPIPPPLCTTRMLAMSPFEKDCYNSIVSFLKTNIVLTGMTHAQRSGFADSLLNVKNSKASKIVLHNLRQACCGGFMVTSETSQRSLDHLLQRDLAGATQEQRINMNATIHGWEKGRRKKCDKCARDMMILILMPCIHLVCHNCLSEDMTHCPVCELSFDVDGMQRLQPGFGLHLKEVTSEMIDPLYVVPHTYLNRAESNVRLNAFSIDVHTKAKYIISKIEEWCQERNHGVKVIVFSQFSQVLRNMKDKLSFHFGKGFVAHYSGPRKQRDLDRFKNIDTCHCLFLPRDGAVGLDLSFVTHIFFMEEVWDKALESQVIARAWRMGCRQQVVVEKLVMADTVEDMLLEDNNRGVDEDGAKSQQKMKTSRRITSMLSRVKLVA